MYFAGLPPPGHLSQANCIENSEFMNSQVHHHEEAHHLLDHPLVLHRFQLVLVHLHRVDHQEALRHLEVQPEALRHLEDPLEAHHH
jgi:hypothetical protein